MSEYIPEKDVFAEIVSNLQRESLDPETEDVKNAIHEVQNILKMQGEITAHEASELSKALRQETQALYALDFLITGKARLLDDDEETVAILREGKDSGFAMLQPDQVSGNDVHGDYYSFYRQQCEISEITVDPVNFDDLSDDEEATGLYHVVYTVTVYDEKTGEEVYAIIHAEDLENIEPTEPSLSKRINDFTRNYPELAEQLSDFNGNYSDDKRSLKKLRDFTLQLDISKYPFRSTQRRDEIHEIISDILWNRWELDKVLYKIKFKGHMLGMGENGTFIPHFQENRIDIFGEIIDCSIQPSAAEGGVIEYTIWVDIMAPAPEFDGGSQLYRMPLQSIYSLERLRNPNLFSTQHLREESPVKHYTISNVPSPQEAPSAVNDEESDDSIDTTFETKIPPSETELEQYLTTVESLWQEVRSTCSQSFATYEEASEVRQTIANRIKMFVDQNEAFLLNVPLEFSGKCIEYVDSVTGSKNPDGTKTVDLKNIAVHTDDSMAIRQGDFLVKFAVEVETQPDDQFSVTPVLIFNDPSNAARLSISPQHSNSKSPSCHVSVVTEFAVHLAKDGNVEIPLLSRLQNCRNVLGKIAVAEPELIHLPEYLSDIKELIDQEDPSEYQELDSEMLQAVTEAIADNESAASLTTEALATILGSRIVDIVGGSYKEGELMPQRRIQGRLISVIESAPKVDKCEPTLVIDATDQQMYYVPISAVEMFRF